MLNDLLYRVRALWRHQTVEAQLEEELRFHLEREAQKNREKGMPAGEAHWNALRALGGTEQTRESCRDARGTRWLEDLGRDVRYGLRMVGTHKMFSALVVSVLALGIGANTAVFSIVHAVILKPLPFRDPARLLAVWDTYFPQFARAGISPPELESWQMQRDLFEAAAWYRSVPMDGDLSASGSEPFAVQASMVSGNLFGMLGTVPILGRGFTVEEDPHSVLLSDRLWRSRWGGDPGIVGKVLRFKGEPFTVVGVMPAAAQFPEWADLWLPKGPLLADALTNPVRHALGFVARRRDGVSEAQAAARLAALARQLAKDHPKTSTGWGIRVGSLQTDLTGDVRPALLLLLWAAAFLLLIACANVASLLLSRASGRAKEMAVRTAVGASTSRIVRQLVTESLLLALSGGLLGWLLAKSALAIALPERSHLDPMVILFLSTTTVATGLLFGLAPALQAVRTDPQTVIKSATMTDSGMSVRSVLVVLEFALTLMLVVGASMLARSFFRLMQVDPGFDPNGVLTVRILAPPAQQPEPLFHRLQERLAALPGIQGVALTNALPLSADRVNTSRFNVPGSPLINADAPPASQARTATPGYFDVMKIAVKAGRAFTWRDVNQSVVIINETMAKRFWPGRDVVGTKFVTGVWGPQPSWSTIIGVVADVKQFGLDSEPTFDVYYPAVAGQYLIVKTSGTALALSGVVERTIHATDGELALSNIRSMETIARESARTRRWTMGLLGTFALLALLLALVGIYGVMSWSVAQRTRELGIRMALGAQRGQVLMLVLRHGTALALLGLAMGIPAAFALRHSLSSLVFGVSTGDPLIYVCVPVLMLLVAICACYLPARKASGVDPSVSLRWD